LQTSNEGVNEISGAAAIFFNKVPGDYSHRLSMREGQCWRM
jgi:hypothetical protein